MASLSTPRSLRCQSLRTGTRPSAMRGLLPRPPRRVALPCTKDLVDPGLQSVASGQIPREVATSWTVRGDREPYQACREVHKLAFPFGRGVHEALPCVQAMNPRAVRPETGGS